jgi:hypothetical protein
MKYKGQEMIFFSRSHIDISCIQALLVIHATLSIVAIYA